MRRLRLGCIPAVVFLVASIGPAASASSQQQGPTTVPITPASTMLGDRRISVHGNNYASGPHFDAMSPNGGHVVVHSGYDLTKPPGPGTNPGLRDYDFVGDQTIDLGCPCERVSSISDDGLTWVWASTSHLTPDDVDSARDVYLHTSDGFTLVTGPATDTATFVAMTPDAAYIVFRTNTKLAPEDPDTFNDLYRWERATGDIARVSTVSGVNGAYVIAMSPDGGKIVWMKGNDGSTPGMLHLWTPEGSTVLATYGQWVGATSDWSTLYLNTSDTLLPEDTGAAFDGYLWDGTDYRLLTPGSPDLGDSIVQIRPDGSAMIVVSAAQLTGDDTDTQADAYLVDGDTTTLISRGADAPNHVLASEDLSSAVYDTPAQLVAADTDEFEDVYRWSLADPGHPQLLSNSQVRVQPYAYADDGQRTLIVTDVPMVPEDTDGQTDVYEYTGGSLRLAFPGSGDVGIVAYTKDLKRIVAYGSKLLPEDTGSGGAIYFSDADLTPPMATIAAPTGVTGTTVTATFGTQANDGVHYTCRVDAGAWTPCHSPQTLTGLSGGSRTFAVRAYDAAGNTGSKTVKWTVDATGPVVSSVTTKPASGAIAGSSTVPVKVTWAATDSLSVIDHYTVRKWSPGDTGWTVIGTGLESTSLVYQTSSLKDYVFRVTAHDKFDNRGARSSREITVTVRQDTSPNVSWSGSWRSASSTDFQRGSARYSTAARASATTSFTGKGVAWVAALGPTRGSVKVYIDGSYAKTVSLYAPSTTYRRVVFAKAWSSTGTHRITLRIVGTAGHARGDVDSIYYIR